MINIVKSNHLLWIVFSANYQIEDKLPESLALNGNGVLKIGADSYPLKIKFDYENVLLESKVS